MANRLPAISKEKLKAEIFDESQITQLIKDPHFTKTVTEIESNAWFSFAKIVENFLGNYKFGNYKDIVKVILNYFQILGCYIGIVVHYLHSHL